MRKRPLIGFFILAFALSWWVWPFALLNPESTPMVPFGPLPAALIVAFIVGRRRGLGALLGSIVRWRVGLRYYAAALVLPAVATLLAVYGNVLLGARAPSAGDLDGWWYALPASFLAMLITVAIWEEPAWRGFALPRMQARFGALPAALLLGVIWALWHLPLSLSGPSTDQRPPLQFALSLVGMSVVYTWLVNRTGGSVLQAILLHAVTNAVFGFFFRMYDGDPDYARMWWLYAGAWGAIALALLRHGLTARDWERAV